MTHWLSDFVIGRVIQVNMNGFLSDKISPIAGVPQGSVLSPLLFLIYAMTYQNLTTERTQNPSLLMTLFSGLPVKMYNLQQNICVRTYKNWQSGVPNWENKTQSRNSEPILKLYVERLKIYSQV